MHYICTLKDLTTNADNGKKPLIVIMSQRSQQNDDQSLEESEDKEDIDDINDSGNEYSECDEEYTND